MAPRVSNQVMVLVVQFRAILPTDRNVPEIVSDDMLVLPDGFQEGACSFNGAEA